MGWANNEIKIAFLTFIAADIIAVELDSATYVLLQPAAVVVGTLSVVRYSKKECD